MSVAGWKYHGEARPDFAEAPGPGSESVWDYPRPPRVERDPRRVVVRAEGRILADTVAALRVLETASPPTFYLPGADIDLDALEAAGGGSICEWKGAARYWALRGGKAHDPVGWDYPSPTAAFAALSEHIAFYPGRVECEVAGERVRPQAGGFYGGWVTDELVGPFKGEPGTGHW